VEQIPQITGRTVKWITASHRILAAVMRFKFILCKNHTAKNAAPSASVRNRPQKVLAALLDRHEPKPVKK
jgi:hypothetical protein